MDSGAHQPSVSGLLETALYVDDPQRSAKFYTDLFQFETLFVDERMHVLSVVEKQVLLLFRKGGSSRPTHTPGGIIPPTDGSGNLHLAFAIPSTSLEAWEARLKEKGVAIESRVTWKRGGKSLYFRDPDKHLLELVTPGAWSIY